MQCLYCCIGWGHCVLERGIGVLIPFLIWVVNFDWTSGILIQLLNCVVKLVSASHGYKGETMRLHHHNTVVQLEVFTLDSHDALRARHGDLHCDATCYSQLLMNLNTVSLAFTLLSICLDRRTPILVSGFMDLWRNESVLHYTFCQHPTADVLARRKRF